MNQRVVLSIALLALACDAPSFLTRATPTVLFAKSDTTPTGLPRATGTSTRSSATATPAPAEIENAAQLQETAEFKANAPMRVVWSLGEQSLGVVTQSGITVFNAQTWQFRRTLEVTDPVRLLDLSPDLRVYLTTTEQKSLDLRDINTGGLLRSIRLDAPALGVNFSPDAKTIVVAHTDGIAASLWDAQTGQMTRKLTGFETAAPVYGARIASDNKTLIWISRGTIQLMDIASGKLGARFAHEDFVMGEALTPDGKTLVTLAEGTITFWNAATGNKSKLNPPLNPSSLALSPGGRVLAFGVEKNILLWDLATQKQMRALTGHAARVNAVAFAHEGLRLASASEDGVIKVWGVVK